MNCVFVYFFLAIIGFWETDHPPLPYVNIITSLSLRAEMLA